MQLAVQTLVLLGIYAIVSPNPVPAFHIVALATSLATSLGLQRKSDAAGSKVWWSLYTLERQVASSSGRPLVIRDEDIAISVSRGI
jgi:hypothetical protein